MITFLDFETNGLPKMNEKSDGRKVFHDFKRLDIYNNSRIVQFSYVVYHLDGRLESENDFIIKPTDFYVTPESTEIHHITHERALKEGEDINNVLMDFESIMNQTNLLVMHNAWFDRTILLSEAYRAKKHNLVKKIFDTRYLCTMRTTKNYCKLPSQYYNGYKNPKLSELHYKLFQEQINPTYLHNSLFDAKVTAKCFFKLLKNKIIKL
jgi:DNA polymerase III epsilon subunit-like protein